MKKFDKNEKANPDCIPTATIHKENDAYDDKKREVLECAISSYGETAQLIMAIEEMSELTKALCKYKRAKTPEDVFSVFDNITEEIADVKIMLEQIEIMFGCRCAVKRWETMKINRLKKRLESENGRK